MDERRVKGLCFNYDKNFHSGYACKSKLFSIVITNEGLEEMENQDEGDNIQVLSQDNPEIRLNPLTSQHTPRTLRLTRYVQNRLIKILIDGGFTHNFIQPILVQSVELPVYPTKTFKVLVGNGQNLEFFGMVRDLLVENQTHKF